MCSIGCASTRLNFIHGLKMEPIFMSAATPGEWQRTWMRPFMRSCGRQENVPGSRPLNMWISSKQKDATSATYIRPNARLLLLDPWSPRCQIDRHYDRLTFLHCERD